MFDHEVYHLKEGIHGVIVVLTKAITDLKLYFQNVFEVLKIEIKILARTKNEFNFKHGCTLCNMENHEISKLI